MSTPFVPLHCHTDYSLLDGACHAKGLVGLAKQNDMPAVSATDHGNIHGAVEFYNEAKAAGVKPIIGVELYVCDNMHEREKGYNHLVVLAENQEGYRNIVKLVSNSNSQGFYYKPRVDKALIAQHSNGLIALSGCLRGDINQAIIADDFAQARRLAGEYTDIFGRNNFFLETQDHGLEPDRLTVPGNRRLSSELGIKLVATNDSHYLTADDHDSHDLLLCVQTGKKASDTERMRFSTREFFVKTRAEMAKLFTDAELDTTWDVAQRCNVSMEKVANPFPNFQIPNGQGMNEYFEQIVWEGFERRAGKLAKLAAQGILRHGENEYMERLDREIGLIKQMGFVPYFLVLHDFIRHARNKKIPVGPGRGSAAGSLVCYSLFITDVDPLQYDLLFERFLNPDRVSYPDVDLDFCGLRRGEVVQYVTEKYGQECVGQIVTFGTMASKAAMKDVARVLDMPFQDANRLSSYMPTKPVGVTLQQALDAENSDLLKATQDDPLAKQVVDTALKIEGMARNTGVHAAGVVISAEPLGDTVPMYLTKDKALVIGYDMASIDKLGMLKYDFLGLATLTVIDNAVKLIKEHQDAEIDLDEIPDGDYQTYREVFCNGNTGGVFQFEGEGMKDLLRRYQPDSLEDLCALNALFRPGPIVGGVTSDFVERKHGRAQVEYMFPELEPILKNTYGLIIYQEQVQQVSNVVAGYTLAEADLLRRAMGKKKPEEMIPHRAKFRDGAVARGFDEAKSVKLFELMEAFAGYGFNKSHALAYAYLAYITGYLKAHYPAEFMAALLTSEAGNVEKVQKYISECRAMGLSVLPPDINKSGPSFTPKDNSILFGLSAIKNMGDASIVPIVEERSAGPYRDIFHFCSRISNIAANKRIMENLVKSGSFDSIGPSRAKLFSAIEPAMSAGKAAAKDKAKGQHSMFDLFEEAEDYVEPVYSQEKEWSDETKLKGERESIGIYVSGHPLDKYAHAIGLAPHSTASLEGLEKDSIVILPALMVGMEIKTNKNGAKWVACRLEDQNGSVEAMIFAGRYPALFGIMGEDKTVLVRGQVMVDEGSAPKVSILDAMPLEGFALRPPVAMQVSVSGENSAAPERLKRLLECARGKTAASVLVGTGHGEAVEIDLNLGIAFSPELMASIRQVCGGEVRVA
jgi:DNA polymerase-3 subunit alpha